MTVAYLRRRGPTVQSNIWGEPSLELARLSKLCRGVPIKLYLAAKRRLRFFWVAITLRL